MPDNIFDLSNLNAERPTAKLLGGMELEMVNALDLGPARGKRIQRLLQRIQNLEEDMDTAEDGHLDALEAEQMTALRGIAKLVCPEMDDATADKQPYVVLTKMMTDFLATTGQQMADAQGLPTTPA